MVPHPVVVVIIPALDEAGAIGQVIRGIPAGYADHVVVADNGSTDDTANIAEAAGAMVIHVPRKGYGTACLAGLRSAVSLHADVVVFLDGDFADDPACLPCVLDPVLRGEADLVLGSRILGTLEEGAILPHQRFGNRVATLLIVLFYRRKLTDIPSFRAIRVAKLEALGMNHPTFGWPVEMVVKALRHGYLVTEVPVNYRRRIGQAKVGGTLKGSLLAGYHMIATILRYVR